MAARDQIAISIKSSMDESEAISNGTRGSSPNRRMDIQSFRGSQASFYTISSQQTNSQLPSECCLGLHEMLPNFFIKGLIKYFESKGADLIYSQGRRGGWQGLQRFL